jgi:uncharacterized pyridoxal phosphate-containing UPF0001 family protein
MYSDHLIIKNIERNYHEFMSETEIQQFVSAGGLIYAATEGKSRKIIECLIAHGHQHFAEKYLQEAEKKFIDLVDNNKSIRLSYFGKLQTNKIKRICKLFHTVESICRDREIDTIRSYFNLETYNVGEFLLQWNISQESQKNGAPHQDLSTLVNKCKNSNIPLNGLMVIPPKNVDPDLFFSKARETANSLQLAHCQMGFSADYRQAIKHGTNRIRISKKFFQS